MKRRLVVLFGFIIAISISSCKLFNPSVMLKPKRNYTYAEASDTLPREYILQKGDIVTFRLFSNKGFKIIDLSTMEDGGIGGNNQLNRQNQLQYLIESDSSVNLPIIGRTKIVGFNLKEAELFLEDRFANYYNDPFIRIEVLNRRVIVFPGNGGAANVVPISNEYLTIVEALALAGGISDGGKAHRVRVFRGNLKDPLIYDIDLSSPEGLAEANMIFIRSMDIIYVEPSYFVARKLLTTTGQLLALITNSIATYIVVTNFTNL